MAVLIEDTLTGVVNSRYTWVFDIFAGAKDHIERDDMSSTDSGFPRLGSHFSLSVEHRNPIRKL